MTNHLQSLTLERFFGRCLNKKTSTRLTVVAFLFLAATLWFNPAVFAAPMPVAVDFELPNLQGVTVRLEQFKGQPILLKLGTTWCPACAQQSKELRTVAAELQAAGVIVVEVFLRESAAQVQKALASNPSISKAIVLIDDQQVQRSYSVYTIPRVLLIDRQFRVQRDGGLISAAELRAALPTWAARQP